MIHCEPKLPANILQVDLGTPATNMEHSSSYGSSLKMTPTSQASSTTETSPITPINPKSSTEYVDMPESGAQAISHILQPKELEIVQNWQDSATDQLPLWLIHDGSGLCAQYHRLESLQRTVYAIHDPKFFSDDSWTDVSEMAEEYAQLIRRNTSGSCIVGGWSFGGIVAFEVARTLSAVGFPVAGVVLIDSPSPINHQPLSPRIIDTVINSIQSDERRTTNVGGTIRQMIRRNFISCAGMLAKFKPDDPAKTGRPIPSIVLLRSTENFRLDDGSIENPWLQDRSNPGSAVAGWEMITNKKVPVIDIPGNHFQPFQPAQVCHSFPSSCQKKLD